MKYRRKPQAVEAMQYTGDNAAEIVAWASPGYDIKTGTGWENAPIVSDGEGGLDLVGVTEDNKWWVSQEGSWIIRTPEGAFECLSDKVFQELFEPISE